MGGFSDSYSNGGNCPCNDPPGGRQQVSSFVDSNYFCESGNPNENVRASLYTDDPLWDGQGCGSQEGPCCAGLPWFHRNWTTPTSEYIELRVCGDQNTNDEDTPISYYEIYIK
jgi:dynein heavy chain